MQTKQTAKNTGKQASDSAPMPPSIKTASKLTAHSSEGEIGEGSYSGTRQYEASLKGYLERADVEKDAKAAAPASKAEARAMDDAEQAGRKPAVGATAKAKEKEKEKAKAKAKKKV